MISLITSSTNAYTCFFWILVLCFCFHNCSSKDNITTGESISDGTDYLESAGKEFQMGFFSPQTGPEKRYVGIWYVMDPNTIVWVANRDDPVLGSAGNLTVAEDGEVKVVDKDQKIHFQTKTGTGGAPQMSLKLLDSGNAVLIDIVSGSIKWQSFLFPTDTFLPGMKMDSNLKLTSSKTAYDPSTGKFTFQLDEETTQYVIVNNEGIKRHWKSGSGSLNNFDPKPLDIPAYELLSNSTSSSITFACNLNASTRETSSRNWYGRSCLNISRKTYTRLLMNYRGSIEYYRWDRQWYLDWQAPKDTCSIYGVCGKFGMCNPSNYYTCTCLQGFEPVAPEDLSAGCKQKIDKRGQNDSFLNVYMIYVENPTLPAFQLNESACKNECLQSKECTAYSYTPAIEDQARSGRPAGTNRCWIWDSELYNLRSDGKLNISIRVSGAVDGYWNQAEDSPFDNS